MPLPPGYTLDPPASQPVNLPPGYTLDPPTSTPGAANTNPSLNATISAEPQPQGLGDRLARWSQNVMTDIKYGTDLTGIGHVLKKMGAHGVDVGSPEAVGNFMASMPLGVLQATKGAGEVQNGQPLQGAKDMGAGILTAAQMPSAFMGAEPAAGAVEAGGEAAAGAVDKAAGMIPSIGLQRAHEAFDAAERLAGDLPINPDAAQLTAARIKQLGGRGASVPKVARDFLKRVNDPEQGPMTYSEARDFYSNATRIAADEAQRLTPVMKAQMAQFTSDLGKAIEQTADHAGALQDYKTAMGQYSSAMRNRAIAKFVWTNALRTAAAAGGLTGAVRLSQGLFNGGK